MEQKYFSSVLSRSEILSVLNEIGFKEMSEIQMQSMPLLLEGKDVIGKSKTGSGKTAAFALPILEKITLDLKIPQALIICPTRELAQQVVREFRRLGRKMNGLHVILLAGGQPAREQASALRKGAHVAVGTPGRILDLIYKGKFFLGDLKTVVLDEADKMLELGFEADIRAILEETPKTRQTLFFSATFPEVIEKLSQKYQTKPIAVSLISQDEDVSAIEQIYYEYEIAEKQNTLMRVLQQHPAESIIIFCNQRVVVDELVIRLQEKGASCAGLHGNLEQIERDRVMALFRNGSYRILVATDVAARGLDIANLELVINYDFPLQPETYIHRIGRTGRAGKKGVAITLIQPHEEKDILNFVALTKGKAHRSSLGFKNQYGLMSVHTQPKMITLMISAGRKDKLRPGDILGALTGESGKLSADQVGKIEIHDTISYVAIAAGAAEKVLVALKNGKIKGQKFYVKIIETK